MVSAQAPDQGYWLAADSAVDAGDAFLVPADSEVGLAVLGPPDGGYMPMGGGAWPTVQFYCPPYPGESCPLLCPLNKPPLYLGALVWARGQPPWGTCPEPWSWNASQERWQTVYTSTDNNLNTCLTHMETVTYFVEGEEPVSAESGYIRVFDADLTFEGGDPDPQCNVEAETGFFMALGPERKLLSLHLQPADPKAVFPEGFQYWWEHDPQPPPPYTTGLWLSGTACVDFYSALTGGDP